MLGFNVQRRAVMVQLLERESAIIQNHNLGAKAVMEALKNCLPAMLGYAQVISTLPHFNSKGKQQMNHLNNMILS